MTHPAYISSFLMVSQILRFCRHVTYYKDCATEYKKGYGLRSHSRWPILNRQHNTLVKQRAYFIDWKGNAIC